MKPLNFKGIDYCMQGGGRDFRKCMLRLPATPDKFSVCLRFKNLLKGGPNEGC